VWRQAVHILNPRNIMIICSVGYSRDRCGRRPASGQFELRTSTETYLRDGRFDQDRMLQVFEQLASGNAQGISAQSHHLPHEWAADGRSHVDDLVEFESRVNDVWRRHDDAVICTYDLANLEETR